MCSCCFVSGEKNNLTAESKQLFIAILTVELNFNISKRKSRGKVWFHSGKFSTVK